MSLNALRLREALRSLRPAAIICAAVALSIALRAEGEAQNAARAAQDAAVRSTLGAVVGPSQIFTLLFITLGPLKIFEPFLRTTSGAGDGLRRKITLVAFAASTCALFLAMFIGETILSQWDVSLPALILTGGALLFFVAFRSQIDLYEPSRQHADATPAPSIRAAISPLAFPVIATPYGIAILIILKSALPQEAAAISWMLAAVMVLNLLGMLFAHRIVRYAGVPLQLAGTILNVFQAALGMQLLLLGVRTAFSAFTH